MRRRQGDSELLELAADAPIAWSLNTAHAKVKQVPSSGSA